MEHISEVNKFVSLFTDIHLDEARIVKSGRNYFYASEEIMAMRDEIKRDIFSLGVFLGEFKGRLEPSPALVDMIAHIKDSDKRKLVINKKAEWLFLCGRNILQDSIVKNPHKLTEGYVLVQNEENENLGYGLFKQEGKELVIRNLLDKGKYLRYNERRR